MIFVVESPTIRPRAKLGGACDLLVVLERMKHYDFFIDRRCRLFLAVRKATPFESNAEIETCFGRIEELLISIPRKRFSLLVDARSGPLRNDPAYEATLTAHRGKLLLGFAKNAAVAATAAGQMQIQRFARVDGRKVFATDDPAAAFEYLGLPKHEW